MNIFNLHAEQVFHLKNHMGCVLGTTAEGDGATACWEPGQTSRTKEWPSNPGWRPRPEDFEYFWQHPRNRGEVP